MRIAFSMMVAALLVTGCLFPSFDDMQGAQKGTLARNTGAGAKAAEDAAEVDDVTPGDAAVAPDPSATVDASTTPDAGPRTIACGSAQCPVGGGGFCCAGYGSCGENADGQIPCSGLGNGRVLECDDNDDCGGTQVCCYVEANKKASCEAACTTGAILCNAASPRCPGAMQCNGTVTTPAFTSGKCQ